MDKKKVFLAVTGGVLGATVAFATIGAKRKKGAVVATVVGAAAGAGALALGDHLMNQPAA